MAATVKHKTTNEGESMNELRTEVEELRELVHTLLTIIMQEADGIQTGAAPMIPNHPKRRFSM
jgi:DNA-binding protein Fis|tara:strand:- start:497 stop:685 length:189 start_codon:yes stop_codon:yes gene_type:complete